MEVVPEETSPWKPEHAPQAIVVKRSGKMTGEGVPPVREVPKRRVSTRAGYSMRTPPRRVPTKPAIKVERR